MLWPKDCLMLSQKFCITCNSFHDSGQWGKSVFNLDANQEVSWFSKYYKEHSFLPCSMIRIIDQETLRQRRWTGRKPTCLINTSRKAQASRNETSVRHRKKTEELGRMQQNTHGTRMEKIFPALVTYAKFLVSDSNRD